MLKKAAVYLADFAKPWVDAYRREKTRIGGFLVVCLLGLAAYALGCDKEEAAILIITNAITLIGGFALGRNTAKAK